MAVLITEDAIKAVAEKLLEIYSSEYANDFDWTEFAEEAAQLLAVAQPHLLVERAALPDPPPPRPRDPEIVS